MYVLFATVSRNNKLSGRPPQYAPTPCKLTFDLLTLKVVSVSRVTWANSVPILAFLGFSVLNLGPMYETDVRRQTDVRRASSLNASALWGRGHFFCCLLGVNVNVNVNRLVSFRQPCISHSVDDVTLHSSSTCSPLLSSTNSLFHSRLNLTFSIKFFSSIVC